MKKLLYILLFVPFMALSQVPQGVNYQAVAYDAYGFELANQGIRIQISLLEGSPSADISYAEQHTVTTDHFGMFSIIIGQGETIHDFTELDWSKSNFLRVEMDTNLDGSYSLLGVTAFNSVPYSFMAENIMNPEGLKDNMGNHRAAQTLDMDSNFVSRVLAPELPLDAANKQYVDGLIDEVIHSSSMELSTQSSESMNFGEALLYCDTLTEGGNSNWAIPSLEIVMFISGGGGQLNGTRTSDYIWTSSLGFAGSNNGGVSYNLVFNILEGIHTTTFVAQHHYISNGGWPTYIFERSYYTRCYR